MARHNGRDIQFRDSTDNVLGVAVTQSFTINNSPVDVTGNDDAAFVTLLSRPGTKQITFEATCVFDDTSTLDLRAIALAGSGLLAEYDVCFMDDADAGSPAVVYRITCDWFLSSVSFTGASDGRIEFSASFASSGAWEVATV